MRFTIDPDDPRNVLDAARPGKYAGFVLPGSAAQTAHLLNVGKADADDCGWSPRRARTARP